MKKFNVLRAVLFGFSIVNLFPKKTPYYTRADALPLEKKDKENLRQYGIAFQKLIDRMMVYWSIPYK